MSRALIVVDVQHDFLPGGSLAVPNGDRVIEPLAREIREGDYDVIVFSRDAHPHTHCSFVEQGGTWPAHCVAGTTGAMIHRRLTKLAPSRAQASVLVDKGTDPHADAYSAFDPSAYSGDGLDLAARLRKLDVDTLVVGGLATDYCVKATVLDALREGFDVTVLEDAVAAVNVEPLDGDRALTAMEDAGAVLS